MKPGTILKEMFVSGDLGQPLMYVVEPPKECTDAMKKPRVSISRRPSVIKNKYRMFKLEESTSAERQTQFAMENFKGLDPIGREITKLSNEIKKIYKDKNSSKEDWIHTTRANEEHINTLWAALTIKLNTVFGHAINGDSTTALRKLIGFMDKYSVNERIFLDSLKKLGSSRYIESDGFYNICAVVAAKTNDLQFIKDLEAFAENNKKRDTYIETKESESRMFNFHPDSITIPNRIALEALVSGSEEVYKYITGGKGINKDYLLKFIKKNGDWFNTRLNSKEVLKVAEVDPSLLSLIQQEMPENVIGGAKDVMDLFFFDDM